MSEILRIANCSGFYGDRLSAAREMVDGGPIDVLTGDYLAELTLWLLHRDRQKDPRLGYARTFLRQLRDVAAKCQGRGIKIVVNAGGLNPSGCAAACRAVYCELGLDARVAHIEGDDLLGRLDELQAHGETSPIWIVVWPSTRSKRRCLPPMLISALGALPRRWRAVPIW